MVGDVFRSEDAVLAAGRVAVPEVLANELGVDSAADHDMGNVDMLRTSSRTMLCASARNACLAPENAAKLAEPRRLAVAPIKRIVPRPRATMRFAASRP